MQYSLPKVLPPAIEGIQFHREILDWRDKHHALARDHLSKELAVLFAALDAEVEKMELKDFVISGAAYTRDHLQPHYKDWVAREVKVIIENSESDLRSTYRQLAEQFRQEEKSLDNSGDSTCTKEIATIALAGCGAVVAIPTFASWSVVSAGGLAGFLGATVISWPIVMAGVAVGGGMLALGGSKAANLRNTVVGSVKKNLRKNICRQVMGNEEGNSVCQRLYDHFDRVSDAILKSLQQ